MNNWLDSIWIKFPKPYPQLAKLVRNYDSRWKAPQILYLGDSVVERISWNDKDKRTLDRMIAAYLNGRRRFLCISHSAYHLQVYYHLLQVLKCTRQKPKIVILPINMRSFSPQWDWHPAWQFAEEIDVLKKYVMTDERKIPNLKNNTDSFAVFEMETRMEVNYPGTRLNRIGQFQDVIKSNPLTEAEKQYRKEQIYIFHYLHPLNPSHPKVSFLGRILELLHELNIGALVYITPINSQGGERFVGAGFLDLVRANAAVIRSAVTPFLEDDRVRFLDLGEALSSDYFFHVDEATEHLNQYGRDQLAKVIATEILQMNGVLSA